MYYRREQNRRKNTRFSIDVDGYYYFGNQWEKCRVYDLNLEGAGLRLRQFFMKGDTIKIKISNNNEQMVLDATVANVNGPRIGIIFENLDEFDKEFLRSVINANSKRYKI
ncbi:MAG: PilZ domain-containing protein [Spirochaetes bacterium]|nr:PilZ domain-containing protein [Spirochaetota bacterium]